jgi:uncharacterized alkaline shock family protein YloU
MQTWQMGSAAVASPAFKSVDAMAGAGVSAADEPGRVRIARRVLHTIVREAALGVPGVARLASAPSAWPSLLGRPWPRDGVALTVHKDVVAADLYLIVAPGLNLVTVGEAVQEAVGAAIEHMLGLAVGAINVFIRDIA